MRDTGLEEVKVYTLRRQNTFVQYIDMQPIMDLCEEAVQTTGTQVSKRWWKQ